MARNTISGHSPKSRANVLRPRTIRLAGGLALLAGLAVMLAAPSAGASQFRAAPPPRPLSPALAQVLPPALSSGLFGPGFPLRADSRPPASEPAIAPGSKWRREQTPNPTVPAGGGLSAMSCTSATTCMAVGGTVNDDRVGIPFAEARNGARWRLQSVPSPAGAVGTRLSGVSCTAADACIAVGFYTSRAGQILTLAEQWNGTSWHIQATPSPVGSAYSELFTVSCAAPTACTAVGLTEGATLAEQWDGTSWAIQATPNPAGATESQLSGVSCTAADACTAVGGWSDSSGPTPGMPVTLAEFWDGTSWSIQPTPNPAGATNSGLFAISCTSAQACTATGFTQANGIGGLTLAEFWDGTSWSIQPTPNPAGNESDWLSAVSCTSAQACTAVGTYLSRTNYRTVAERWDGTSWTIQPTPNPGLENGLGPISCTSARACTALGFYHSDSSDAETLTLAATWNGASWETQATPNPAGAALFSSLNAVSCRSARACTAVGIYLDGSDHIATLAEVRAGTRWHVQATPNPAGAARFSYLTAVSCTSPRACMAVGYSVDRARRTRVLAEARNGSRWRIQATSNPGTFDTLSAISCTSARACTAAGYYVSNGHNKTLVEAWNGTRWRIQATPNPRKAFGSVLSGVSCTSPKDCIAVGYSADRAGRYRLLAEAWNGTRWRIQATPAPPNAGAGAVSCSARHRCTLVGGYVTDDFGDSNTLAEGWNGTRWRIQATVNPSAMNSLAAVSCTSPQACTAVGDYQQDHYANPFTAFAETWNGARWSSQAIADFVHLPGVSCYSAGACTAVGNDNDGLTFVVATSGG